LGDSFNWKTFVDHCASAETIAILRRFPMCVEPKELTDGKPEESKSVLSSAADVDAEVRAETAASAAAACETPSPLSSGAQRVLDAPKTEKTTARTPRKPTCKGWVKGACSHGEKCKFAHERFPCYDFRMRGSCARGAECLNLH
jgi:hypothetical protein